MKHLVMHFILAAALAAIIPVLAPGATHAQNIGCETMGMCYEYAGEWWNDERRKSDCESDFVESTLLEGPCPLDDVVGICTYDPQGDPSRRIVYRYYAPSFTEKTARMSCPGTFGKVE
jgi:hypothetical protein